LQIEGSTLKTEVLKFAAKTAAALPFWELWAWPMAKNFIAGPDLQKAKKRALRLSQKGYPLIFNYAGEHASDFKTAQTAYNANIELIEWLKKRKVSFQDCDVSESQNSQYRDELLEKTGQLGVPVTDFNGILVIGFNEKKLEEALEKAKK